MKVDGLNFWENPTSFLTDYSFNLCNKTRDTSNLWEGGFTFALGFRDFSHGQLTDALVLSKGAKISLCGIREETGNQRDTLHRLAPHPSALIPSAGLQLRIPCSLQTHQRTNPLKVQSPLNCVTTWRSSLLLLDKPFGTLVT